MKVVLELCEQSSNIRSIAVHHDVVIGRGSDCNLRVSAPQVSRRHCFLRILGDRVSITDLESCNGTWLDGQRTVPGKRYFLTDGMKLAVGPVRFIVRLVPESPDADVVRPAGGSENPSVPDEGRPSHQTRQRAGHAAMNFAIEHAGAAAPEDEPTRDYSVAVASQFRLSDETVRIAPDNSGSEELIELNERRVSPADDGGANILTDEGAVAGSAGESAGGSSDSHEDTGEAIVLEDD